ncbi:PH domain-containing protein [Fusobacterium sp. oral taxon C10]
MSISFYVKNKKKFLGYETVLNVEEALTILNKELNTYNTRNIDINDLLLSPVSNYECLLIGEDKVSARGFELSYDNKNKDYAVRIFTPSSREDWLLALEYIKALAKKFGSEIINERGEVYTVDNIDKFDYKSDILYGIEVVSSNLKDKDVEVSSIYGINRIVSFNKEMLDKINNSDSPIDTFSNIVKEIQYLDAYSANQQFYKNKADGKIIGAYTLTQNLRTILPYKPSVEFENSDIVKNEDISLWNIGLVTINGDENDPNSYQVAGNLNYDDFIKKLSVNKYKFIDASYIMVEPLSKEEILDLLK